MDVWLVPDRKEWEKVIVKICEECKNDPKVFCPRDVDVKCLICDKEFCGAHIAEHLKKVHLVSLNLDHCSTKETPCPKKP